MKIVRKNWIARMFCEHDHKPFTKSQQFHSLSGETVYNICVKCGHQGSSIYREYEGSGYK